MTYKLIDGKAISNSIKIEIKESVSDLIREHSIKPGLTVILVGNDPASQVYVRNKRRSAIETGMCSTVVNLPGSTSKEELLSRIVTLNHDDNCHGILVQLPLPDHLDENEILASIDPEKDVDGLHPKNIGLLSMGSPDSYRLLLSE